MRAPQLLEFGLIGINDPIPSRVEAPIGGWKESGLGREGGRNSWKPNMFPCDFKWMADSRFNDGLMVIDRQMLQLFRFLNTTERPLG